MPKCALKAKSKTSSDLQVSTKGLQDARKLMMMTELAASLSSLGKIAWFRLDNDQVRFTVIPEQGSQVWA
jgi:hypothetical protein